MGGLGNQLFQYALGRALADRRASTLKLDISGYGAGGGHAYALRHFNILESLATRDEIRRLRGAWFPVRLPRRVHKANPFRKRSHVLEKAFAFDAGVLESPDDVYLDGYWQSEKYFKPVEAILRREFTVRHPLEAHNREMADRIAACNAVSLHVRRGDFVSNPKSLRVHGVCGLDYYHSAVRRVAEASAAPHFFVFSDDPDWTARNLRIELPITFVSGNAADRGYDDMRLMSLCKHHIIANSSFSWWGAWLGTNPGKVVVAPARWFATEEHDTKDLFPPTWQTI